MTVMEAVLQAEHGWKIKLEKNSSGFKTASVVIREEGAGELYVETIYRNFLIPFTVGQEISADINEHPCLVFAEERHEGTLGIRVKFCDSKREYRTCIANDGSHVMMSTVTRGTDLSRYAGEISGVLCLEESAG